MQAVHVDQIPARITTPAGTLDKLRFSLVTLDDGRTMALAFGVDDRRNITVALAQEAQAVDVRVGAFPWVIQTAAGETWTVVLGSGCGCGSPVKRAKLSDLVALVPAA